jgi:NAD-dependent SIR2 family protein deacetylase
MSVLSLHGSATDTNCGKCGDSLIVLDGSYDFSEEDRVINLWSCVSCGNKFETVDDVSEIDHKPFEVSSRSEWRRIEIAA